MIKITKFSVADKPKAETPNKNNYKYGEDNGEVSLPVDYWAVGNLLEPIKVGKPIKMERFNRNGIECYGIFISSPVTKLCGKIAETFNSKYLIEEYKMISKNKTDKKIKVARTDKKIKVTKKD
jgi:hypothetical protein